MSLNKRSFSVLLLVIAAGVATFHGLAQNGRMTSNTVRFKANDLRDRGLTILVPSDSEFATLIANRFDKDNELLRVLKPYSVMLQNATSRPLVGYAVRWQFKRPDGTFLNVTRNYLTLWRLLGITSEEPDELTVQPHSQTLLTSANFSFTPTTSPGKPSSAEEVDAAKQTAAELTEFTEITVTLDGAFFDDGSFLGPDASNFFSKVDTRLKSKRDLYLEITEGARRGANPNQVFKQVENIANGPKIALSSSPTPEEFYLKYKQEAATEILRIRSASGDAKTAEYAESQLHHKWPDLRKLP